MQAWTPEYCSAEMEERISNTEDTIEEIDSSVKENTKSNKSLTQKMEEI